MKVSRCVRGRLFLEQQYAALKIDPLPVYTRACINTRCEQVARGRASYFIGCRRCRGEFSSSKLAGLLLEGATSANGIRFMMGNYQQASSPYASMPSLYISGAKAIGGTPPIVVQPAIVAVRCSFVRNDADFAPPLALTIATRFDVTMLERVKRSNDL